MALLKTSETEQIVFAANGCSILSCSPHECSGPVDKTWFARLCGSTKKGTVCCLRADEAACLCPGHELYDTVLKSDKPEGVCCIISSGQSVIVKPYCLSGEQPCCKGVSDFCCFHSRYACPCDADTPPMCATYGIKCCDLGDPFGQQTFKCDLVPCAKIAPASKDSQVAAIETEQAHISSEEYLMCGYCCCIMSMYIPATYKDAMGCENKGLIYACVENECQACQLPARPEEETLLLAASGQTRCVKPTGPFCKGVSRVMCMVCKFAFPCDNEVPCVFAICGQKCVEKSVMDGQIRFGDDKKVNPTTMRKPLFSPIVTHGAMSVKEKSAPTNETVNRS